MLRANGDPTTFSRRMLTIHAHPDDEASKGGASAARYAAAPNSKIFGKHKEEPR
jgi:LmbE family N-acetylglucosaminyl deacetylase